MEVIKQYIGKIYKPFHCFRWNGVLSSILVHNFQFFKDKFNFNLHGAA